MIYDNGFACGKRLYADLGYVTLFNYYEQNMRLYPAGGYNPLVIKIIRLPALPDVGGRETKLVFEQATIENFIYNGLEFNLFENNSSGGKIIIWDTLERRSVATKGGMRWRSPDVIIAGDPSVIAGNEILFTADYASLYFSIISSLGILDKPIFRLRRKGDFAVAGELLGNGDGVTNDFVFNTANFFITPGSIKINIGAEVDVVRDNSAGELVNLPPRIRLRGLDDKIDYINGKIELGFLPNSIPPAVPITIDYEYAGQRDTASYIIECLQK